MDHFLKRDLLPLKETNILSLLNGKICIKETQHINASAIIKDIISEMNLKVYSFYETKSFYGEKAIFGIEDTKTGTLDLQMPFLVDDTFSYMNFGNEIRKEGIYVFRSDSCREEDLFKFDLIMELSGLDSGRSDMLDGKLVIKKRNNVLKSMFFVKRGDKVMFTY